MEIILFLSSNKENFIIWLIKHIRRNWTNYIDIDKLIRLDDYLNSDEMNIKWINNQRRQIKIIDLINICFHNLTYTCYKDKIVIHFNKKNLLPFSFTKIYDIAKFINFGNLQVKGENLFTRMFVDYENHIVQLYEIYLKERMLCH